MSNNVVVSEMDIKHLALIRENVKRLIAECGDTFDKDGNVILDVAPQIYKGAKEFFKKATVKTLDIDPKSNADYIADICMDNSGLIKDSSFDVIICTEVLEHTNDPFGAVKEMYRLLKPGGTLASSTPFNFRIHGPLPDNWRFSEHGLRQLFKAFKGLQIRQLETEGRDLFPVHYTTLAVK